MTDQTATIPAGQPPTEDTIGLCGYCGVPRENHHHGYVSTAEAIAAAPHRVTAAASAVGQPAEAQAADRAAVLREAADAVEGLLRETPEYGEFVAQFLRGMAEEAR